MSQKEESNSLGNSKERHWIINDGKVEYPQSVNLYFPINGDDDTIDTVNSI